MQEYSKYWTALLCGIFNLLHVQAQDLAHTRLLARAALARSDYAVAEPLWLRVRYFAPDDAGWETSAALGEVYFHQQRYVESAEGYDYAARLAPQDSLRIHFQFQAAIAWLQAHDYGQMQDRLQVMGLLDDSLAERRRQFYLGSAAYGLADYVMAEAHWTVCADNAAEVAELHALFEAHARIKPKHVGPYIALSHLLPGLGQLALGHPGRALNSILLVGAIVGGGIYVGAVVGIADALVLLVPAFTRYYVGGAQRAGKDARAQLRDRRQVILGQMLDLVGD